MQITSITLLDFQSHAQTVVEFSPTITTIVGTTDAGKSAVLRALGWICLNNFTGEEFIREGAKRTTVEVRLKHTEKEHLLVRTKGNGGNVYSLNGADFKAFATNVPIDIANLLQLNEINFQEQHDGPFWFDESPAEVSRRLNAVIDLSVIDTALSAIAVETYRAQQRVSLVEERLNVAISELAVLKPQQTRIEQFQILQQLNEKSNVAATDANQLAALGRKAGERRHQLSRLEGKIEAGQTAQDCASDVLATSERVVELARLLSQLSKRQSASVSPPDFTPVETAYTTCQSTNTDVETLTDLIRQSARQQNKATPPPTFDSVETLYETWRTSVADAESLTRNIEWVERLTARNSKVQRTLLAIEKQHHDQLKGELCPLCGNQVS